MKDEIIFGRKNLAWIFTATLLTGAVFSLFFPSNFNFSLRKRQYLFIFLPIADNMNSLYTLSAERQLKRRKFSFSLISPKCPSCLIERVSLFLRITCSLDVCMDFSTQFLPLLIDLHYLVFSCILSAHLYKQRARRSHPLQSAQPAYLKGLGITILGSLVSFLCDAVHVHHGR